MKKGREVYPRGLFLCPSGRNLHAKRGLDLRDGVRHQRRVGPGCFDGGLQRGLGRVIQRRAVDQRHDGIRIEVCRIKSGGGIGDSLGRAFNRTLDGFGRGGGFSGGSLGGGSGGSFCFSGGSSCSSSGVLFGLLSSLGSCSGSFLCRLVAELIISASGQEDDDGADDHISVHVVYSHNRRKDPDVGSYGSLTVG
jgi:hypothetical protein